MTLEFFSLKGIICFLNKSLVVMLILGLAQPVLLLIISLISMTFLVDNFRKVSLIQMMFFMLYFEAYI